MSRKQTVNVQDGQGRVVDEGVQWDFQLAVVPPGNHCCTNAKRSSKSVDAGERASCINEEACLDDRPSKDLWN